MSTTESLFSMQMQPTSTPNFYVPVFSDTATLGTHTYGLGGIDIPAGFFDTGCLQGCLMSSTQAQNFNLLEATFSSPVSSANVQMGAQQFNAAIVLAFNSAGQVVASCEAAGGDTGNPCYSLTSTPGIALYSVNAPGITSLLIGGIGGTIEPVWNVDPPVALDTPVTFYLLLLGIVAMWRPKIAPSR